MQSRLLRHFLAAYNHLNITSAADALSITQPALTKSIQLLEAQLGVQLFERLPNGVVPTPFGEALAKHSTSIFLEYDHALAEIEAMKGGSAGTIRIGAGPLWLTHFLPPAIAAYRTTHPAIKLVLDGAVISTAVPALLRGEIEIFCGALDFPDHPQIDKREMDHIEHVVVAGRNHPLHTAGLFKPARLLDYPWAMLGSDDVGRQRLAAYFASNGLVAPRATLETTSIICILQNLQQGDFLACLAKPLLQSASAAGLMEVDGPEVIWRYPAGLAIRNRARIPPATNQFVDSVISTYYQKFKRN